MEFRNKSRHGVCVVKGCNVNASHSVPEGHVGSVFGVAHKGKVLCLSHFFQMKVFHSLRIILF